MQKLIEFNENQDTPPYRPSHLQELKHRSEYFEVPDLDTKVQRHDNPHYWLQRDILQIKHFQYRLFTNIILTDDTIPQVKIFTQFLLKFLRFNYQLIWEQKDQQAYINFPQILTHIELLPYIIKNENKHLHYRDLTSLNVTHFEQITLDHNFVLEHSETSDNRPFTTPDTSHETTPEEQTSSVEPSYTRQQSDQSEQESPEQEALTNLFQNPDLPQEQLSYPPLSQISDMQQPNPSETNTTHNTSEFSEETVQNIRSFTITDDSNLILVPTHNITQNEFTNQNQNNTSNTNPDNTSILSTSNTNITQPSQTQIIFPRNYNPPSVPPQFSTQINTHDTPQQSSSNTPYIAQNNNIVHFQTPTPPLSSEIQTSNYTPAQTNSVQTTQPTLNINTIHSDPSTDYTTARHLSRPPLQPILTNPLSYSLTSINPSQPQQSQINYNTSNQLNTLSSQHTSNTITPTLQTSQFHIPNPPSTTIRTNPHFHSTSTTSLPNISNNPTYNTTSPSTMSHNTMSHPTYINSSTSISEPIKPFDGLDHNYTPEEYLQHIGAGVTFSLGLQPTSEHEYKFWHARRMAFIQCSLTGTALSWYIRLNDTYKHDWHAFVQAFKKQFSSQKNAYYAQVEALNLTKKDNETVRHFALKVKQLVEKGWCNENASTINLKCNEIFTKGLPKNLKDFANKRQVKHTSTVLEPSIPFHTLVKLVDAEDIANDKIRTHDLALEINNVTKQLITHLKNNLCIHNPKTQITKINLHIKNIAHTVIEQITPFLLVSKNNEMMKINEKHMLDQNLHKNHSFSTFVLLPMTEQNTMIIDTEVEVPHETTLITKGIHKTDTVLHLEIETNFVMTKVLLLHTTPDQDMIHTNVILDLTVLLTDLLIDPHIDKTLVLDTDHAPIQEITNSPNTQIHIDHLQDQETLDFLDLAHTQIPEIKSI